MINCMVSRRIGPGRVGLASRLVIPETAFSISSEFQDYFPDDNVLFNRRSSSIYGFGGDGAFSQKSGMFSLQGFTVDGRPTVYEDGDDVDDIMEPILRPGRGEKMLSKHFIAPSARCNRRASLHGCDFRFTEGTSALESDSVLHPKEVLYLQKIALASNEETRRKDLSNGMAHISLDGRIMDAVSATSLATIGGNLGEEEAQAWDCFAPLQRVLIVAVAAAAAASSKHKNHKEINRLQKEVQAQEDALSLMRRELSNLWDQVAEEENGPLSFKTPTLEHIDQKSRSASPVMTLKGSRASNSEGLRIETPKTHQRPKRELPDGLEICNQFEDDPASSDVFTPMNPKATVEEVQFGELESFRNLLVENTSRNEDGYESEHYFEDCTPEKRQRIFSRFALDAKEPSGWTPVKSSFTTISADNITPLTNKTRYCYKDSIAHSKGLEQSSGLEDMRARCATMLLEVKDQVASVLDKEASHVMAALSHVIEKAQKLERADRTNSFSRRASTPEKTARASTALKKSVEKASAQVASLQSAVVNIWNTIGRDTLASLNPSPLELESFLLQVMKDSLTNKEHIILPTSEEGIQECKHRDPAAPSLLSKNGSAANFVPVVENEVVCSPSWRNKGAEISSAIRIAVRKTVDSLMAPLDGRKVAEDYRSPEARKRLSPLSEDAPQFLAQQLLGELEKAAAKIAGMECQMLSLKQSVRETDAERKKAEIKLAEAISRDHQNQEIFEREMSELTAKLREKESAYDELMRSRKVMYLVKSKEIDELRKDCQMRDAALDDITAAAQATREASDQRMAVLEDICRRKDSAIQELKEEIIALEDKVHELELRSPLLLSDNHRRNISLFRSSIKDVLALENTFNGISHEREKIQISPPRGQTVAFQSTIDDTVGYPQSSPNYTSQNTMDFCSEIHEDQAVNGRFIGPSGNELAVPDTMAESISLLKETSSVNSILQGCSSSGIFSTLSIDRSMFPSPSCSLFDDFLEVESSLQSLAMKEESHLDDFRPRDNTSNFCSSHDYFSAGGNPNPGLKQLCNTTASTCTESAGSNTKLAKSRRAKGHFSLASAGEHRKTGGILRPTKASSLKAQGKIKANKEKENFASQQDEEINWINVASFEFGSSVKGSAASRRASNTSVEYKESIVKPASKENKGIRRSSKWH